MKRAAHSKPSTIPPPNSRRTPLQHRSRERVERILDAAAHVFSEAGYDAATTEAIAQRAGTSIGSIYQFFPNKLALFNAIAMRHVDRARVLFHSFMGSDAAKTPWNELLDRGLDAFATFHRTEPGFRAILVNWRVSGEMVFASDEVNRELARQVAEILAMQAPGLTRERRLLVATMIIETVSAMLILCAKRNEAFGDAVIQETKTMLRRYVEPIMTEHGAPAAKTVTSGPRSSETRSSSRGTRSRARSSGTRSPRR